MNSCDVIYKIGQPIKYNEGQTIFVKTDYLLDFLRENLETPYILVTGMSDYSPSTFLTDEQIFDVLKNPAIIEWRSQNVCVTHPKLKHLPIGLEDTQSKIDFCRDYGAQLKSITKKDEIYMNFTIDNNPSERLHFLPTPPFQLNFEQYMRTMAQYKYVLCPMGNGIDTHRFWEAQVCGCIPVIRCPKEFLPTYEGVPYISIPGWCAARLGASHLVRKMESVFKITV
jgi:hypothetical protein